VVRDLDVASGGPSRSVPALAESQSRFDGLRIHVLYKDRGQPIVELAESDVQYQPVASRARFSKIVSYALGDTIFHLHGLWSPSLHRSARFARIGRIPCVVSTRGMLADWALGHKALKKKLAWNLYQKRDLEAAACLVASSEFEQSDVAALLPDSRVAVVPNGCDERPKDLKIQHERPDGETVRWALAIGRLHPVKGYAELIEAWAKVIPRGWKLAIAGPDEGGYRAILEKLIATYNLQETVILPGAVDDARKWSLLDQCELFIAPSRTENFGMAIAEALQSGTPVITTRGTPWREIEEHDCGLWIHDDPQTLERILAEATATEAERLREMGRNGRRLIQAKYTWKRVAAETLALYRSILERREP
jgi:glycosyltransferase involved in cell wall biosynthesis